MMLILVLLIAIVSTDNSATLDLLKGFVEGVEAGIGDLESCMKDVSSMYTHYKATIENFEQGIHFKSTDDIKAGFVNFAEALIDTYEAFEDCHVEDLINAIKKVVVEIESEQYLKIVLDESIYIIFHGVHLYNEIKYGVNAYESGDWFHVGFFLGKITIELIKAAADEDANAVCSPNPCGSSESGDIGWWCSMYTGWSQTSCKCIAQHESGGNMHACNKNTNDSLDIGLWQINDVNWGQCSGGKPPCDGNSNLACAKKVFAWGGNTWKLWSTCGMCGCCHTK